MQREIRLHCFAAATASLPPSFLRQESLLPQCLKTLIYAFFPKDSSNNTFLNYQTMPYAVKIPGIL